MILVADAGGTGTEWRLIDGDNISQFQTRGYNPNTHDLADYLAEIKPTFKEVNNEVRKLYFYGASLYPDSTEFKEQMESVFDQATIEINNDLLGSCRSLSANEPGFIGILGTGSAGCFYDGYKIANHPPSLGYALGDEGSGAYLGRKLLNLALRRRLESSMQNHFDSEFGLTKEEVYKRVYRDSGANTFLASFGEFLFKHKDNSQIQNLLAEGFKDYCQSFFLEMDCISDYPFHFTGSIAFYFSDCLRAIGRDFDLSIGKIVQSPIAGLALYHQSNE